MSQLTLISLSEYMRQRDRLIYTLSPCLGVETKDGRDDHVVPPIWHWRKLEEVTAHDELEIESDYCMRREMKGRAYLNSAEWAVIIAGAKRSRNRLVAVLPL